MEEVLTGLNFQSDGRLLEEKIFKPLNGAVSTREKIRELLQKVKRIASKSEINTPKNPLQTRIFSHFEVVEALFSFNSFHFLNTLLDLGIQGG